MIQGDVATRLRTSVRRLGRAVAPGSVESLAATRRGHVRGRAIRREIAELRAEIAETRRLHQRVAELTDLMAEVLVPIADRDDARVQKALEAFARTEF